MLRELACGPVQDHDRDLTHLAGGARRERLRLLKVIFFLRSMTGRGMTDKPVGGPFLSANRFLVARSLSARLGYFSCYAARASPLSVCPMKIEFSRDKESWILRKSTGICEVSILASLV